MGDFEAYLNRAAIVSASLAAGAHVDQTSFNPLDGVVLPPLPAVQREARAAEELEREAKAAAEALLRVRAKHAAEDAERRRVEEERARKEGEELERKAQQERSMTIKKRLEESTATQEYITKLRGRVEYADIGHQIDPEKAKLLRRQRVVAQRAARLKKLKMMKRWRLVKTHLLNRVAAIDAAIALARENKLRAREVAAMAKEDVASLLVRTADSLLSKWMAAATWSVVHVKQAADFAAKLRAARVGVDATPPSPTRPTPSPTRALLRASPPSRASTPLKPPPSLPTTKEVPLEPPTPASPAEASPRRPQLVEFPLAATKEPSAPLAAMPRSLPKTPSMWTNRPLTTHDAPIHGDGLALSPRVPFVPAGGTPSRTPRPAKSTRAPAPPTTASPRPKFSFWGDAPARDTGGPTGKVEEGTPPTGTPPRVSPPRPRAFSRAASVRSSTPKTPTPPVEATPYRRVGVIVCRSAGCGATADDISRRVQCMFDRASRLPAADVFNSRLPRGRTASSATPRSAPRRSQSFRVSRGGDGTPELSPRPRSAKPNNFLVPGTVAVARVQCEPFDVAGSLPTRAHIRQFDGFIVVGDVGLALGAAREAPWWGALTQTVKEVTGSVGAPKPSPAADVTPIRRYRRFMLGLGGFGHAAVASIMGATVVPAADAFHLKPEASMRASQRRARNLFEDGQPPPPPAAVNLPTQDGVMIKGCMEPLVMVLRHRVASVAVDGPQLSKSTVGKRLVAPLLHQRLLPTQLRAPSPLRMAAPTPAPAKDAVGKALAGGGLLTGRRGRLNRNTPRSTRATPRHRRLVSNTPRTGKRVASRRTPLAAGDSPRFARTPRVMATPRVSPGSGMVGGSMVVESPLPQGAMMFRPKAAFRSPRAGSVPFPGSRKTARKSSRMSAGGGSTTRRKQSSLAASASKATPDGSAAATALSATPEPATKFGFGKWAVEAPVVAHDVVLDVPPSFNPLLVSPGLGGGDTQLVTVFSTLTSRHRLAEEAVMRPVVHADPQSPKKRGTPSHHASNSPASPASQAPPVADDHTSCLVVGVAAPIHLSPVEVDAVAAAAAGVDAAHATRAPFAAFEQLAAVSSAGVDAVDSTLSLAAFVVRVAVAAMPDLHPRLHANDAVDVILEEDDTEAATRYMLPGVVPVSAVDAAGLWPVLLPSAFRAAAVIGCMAAPGEEPSATITPWVVQAGPGCTPQEALAGVENTPSVCVVSPSPGLLSAVRRKSPAVQAVLRVDVGDLPPLGASSSVKAAFMQGLQRQCDALLLPAHALASNPAHVVATVASLRQLVPSRYAEGMASPSLVDGAPTAWPPPASTLQPAVPWLVPAAHAFGLAVWVAVDDGPLPGAFVPYPALLAATAMLMGVDAVCCTHASFSHHLHVARTMHRATLRLIAQSLNPGASPATPIPQSPLRRRHSLSASPDTPGSASGTSHLNFNLSPMAPGSRRLSRTPTARPPTATDLVPPPDFSDAFAEYHRNRKPKTSPLQATRRASRDDGVLTRAADRATVSPSSVFSRAEYESFVSAPAPAPVSPQPPATLVVTAKAVPGQRPAPYATKPRRNSTGARQHSAVPPRPEPQVLPLVTNTVAAGPGIAHTAFLESPTVTVVHDGAGFRRPSSTRATTAAAFFRRPTAPQRRGLATAAMSRNQRNRLGSAWSKPATTAWGSAPPAAEAPKPPAPESHPMSRLVEGGADHPVFKVRPVSRPSRNQLAELWRLSLSEIAPQGSPRLDTSSAFEL